MCWFDLVRLGSVRFGWVRRSKRGKKKKDARSACQHMLLLKQRNLLVRSGSAECSGVRWGLACTGLAAKKGQNQKQLRGDFFCGSVWFGSAEFGGVWWGCRCKMTWWLRREDPPGPVLATQETDFVVSRGSLLLPPPQPPPPPPPPPPPLLPTGYLARN